MKIILRSDLDGLGKAPARLDFDKLAAVNSHFLRLCEDDRLFDLLKPLIAQDASVTDATWSQVKRALPHMKDRGATLPDLARAFDFITQPRPVALNKRARKSLSGDGIDRLIGLRDTLSTITDWTTENLSRAIESYCAAQNLSIGQVGPPLRAALTGGLPAPDLAPMMDWLGRTDSLARIDEQITAANTAADED